MATGALAAGAIAWALAILASIATATTNAQKDHRTLLIRWGIALFVVAGLLQFIRESRGRRRVRAAEELAEEYQSLLEVTVADVVAPIGHFLGRIAAAHTHQKRVHIQGQLVTAILGAAANLCRVDQTRAVFFRLEEGTKLVPAGFVGRSDEPLGGFEDLATEGGTIALALVRDHSALLVENATMDMPGGQGGHPVRYMTFISVAVFAGDRDLGMLSVDAPLPGDLTENHLEMLKALANLLGAGLAM